MPKITLGSLFSGIGGFELAGSFYGIEPVWASEIEEPCVRITKQHFPKMKHYGDITKMDGGEIEPVDIISGGSPCFPAGTMVLTKNGYVNIEDIKVGDIVLTHKNRWRKVTAVGNREAETIILKGNCTLETTRNHPIYCADIKNYYPQLGNGKRGNIKQLINVGQWVDAEHMDHRQWATPILAEPLKIPGEVHTQYNQKDLPKMNDKFWYFVGRWIGDGWIRDSKRPEKPTGDGLGTIFLCDSPDKEQELIDTVSPISEAWSIAHERSVTKICFTSQLLSRWLVKHFGKGAINKHLPGFVYGLSAEYRTSLLKGILDSDGYRKDDHHYKISSISKALVLGIRLLAESLGWSTSITMCKRPSTYIIEGRVVNQHDTHTIAITNNPNRHTGLPHDGHKWYLCRSVNPTNQTKTVYNISVEEDESYVADSIVVHNCQSLSIAGKQAGISLFCPDCGYSISANSDISVCPECGAELELTRSGLFMEQIRIIKEMRKATNEQYPKIVIWENVTGALSSNNGNDFHCVIKEFAGLLGEELPTFRPERWSKSGELLGKSGSLAWRTLDAQYWGVPQRRRRIFLVVDLRGHGAREILFKPESLRRHTPEGKFPWERFTGKAKDSIREADRKNEVIGVASQQVNAEVLENKQPTLLNSTGSKPYICYNQSQRSKPLAVASQQVNAETIEDDIPIGSAKEVYGLCSVGSNSMKSNNPNSGFYKTDVSKTLDTNGLEPTCNQGGNVVVQEPVYCIQGNCIDRADTAGCNGRGWKEDVSYTLTTIDRPAVAYAVHSICENGDADVRLNEVAGTLTTGGGKPGQGYQAVLIESESESVEKKSSAAFAYQVGGGLPHLPYNEELSPTLVSNQKMAVLIDNHPADSRVSLAKDDVCQTLSARMGTGGGNVPLVLESEESVISARTGDFDSIGKDVASTLLSRDYKDPQIVCRTDSIVRRLTPLECERLQGFYDNWTASESDASRYKALGNSVAIPCVAYVMGGVVDVLDPIE